MILVPGANILGSTAHAASTEASEQSESGSLSSASQSELLDTLSRLVDLRHRTNPHGYEKDLQFSVQYSQARLVIIKLLASSRSTGLPSEAPQVIADLLRNYDENHDDF
jgi:hypothetical protein